MPSDDIEISVIDQITTSLDAAESLWTEFVSEAGDADAQRRVKSFLSDRFDSFFSDLRS